MDYYCKISRGESASCIVLVHGILGDYKATWGEFPFLICQDSTFNHCDVLCWGYPSKLRAPKFASFPFLGHKTPTVPSVAEALSADLTNPAIGGGYTDLIMVGHSMGGLVVKQMIISALTSIKENTELLDRIRHVVLFATPTDGVQLPTVISVHPQAKSINCDGDFINQLRNNWINRVHSVQEGASHQAGRRRIAVTAVIALEDNAVPRESAQAYYLDCVTAQGTHTEVCKPHTRDATSFQILKKVVQSITTRTPPAGDGIATSEAAGVRQSELPVTAIENVPSAPSLWHEANVFMEEGRFDSAYDAFIRYAGSPENGDRRIEMVSFGLYLLWSKGWSPAFGKLKNLCDENPSISDASLWLGTVCLESERYEQAVACFRNCKNVAIGLDRIFAIEKLSRSLERGGHPAEAMKELRTAVEENFDPPEMARLYAEIGNLLLRQRKDEPQFAIACFEKALALDPHQKDLRFELAFEHGALIPTEEVFYQYRQLFLQESHPAAANNAGVAAQTLKLPLASIDCYRRASEAGNSLAMANMAHRLIEVGFEVEARAQLEKARQLETVHENVDITLGHLQKSRLAEKETIDELDRKVREMISWRKKEGEAVVRGPIPLETLVGEYRHNLGDTLCAVSLSSDGTLIGTATDAQKTISFSGRIEGHLLRVSWSSTPHQKSSPVSLLGIGMNTPDSGKGALVIEIASDNSITLSGYRVKAQRPLDTEVWSFTKG